MFKPPAGVANTQIVEEVTGAVVLVGGYSRYSEFDHILRLSDAKSEWKELPQKISHQRFGHVAFLVPDTYTKCVPSSK